MNNNNKEKRCMVDADGLKKHFGAIRAVDGVSFDVREGGSFGFLGPNGAGKTTVMRMICCMARPTAGKLRVLGLDPIRRAKDIKKDIGVVPQKSSLDDDLTVMQNLMIFARYHGIPKKEAVVRAEELLHFAKLEDRRNERVPHLSGGMQRRLLIARALINKPRILILDEPTTGLDPQVRHLIWQRLRKLRRQGITLLITTHYMEEAENLCEEIVIMNRGKIIVRGAPPAMISEHIGRFTLEINVNGNDTESAVRRIFDGKPCRIERFGDRIYVHSDESEPLTESLREVADFEPIMRPSTLEDVFLKLTGRELSIGA